MARPHPPLSNEPTDDRLLSSLEHLHNICDSHSRGTSLGGGRSKSQIKSKGQRGGMSLMPHITLSLQQQIRYIKLTNSKIRVREHAITLHIQGNNLPQRGNLSQFIKFTTPSRTSFWSMSPLPTINSSWGGGGELDGTVEGQ